MRDNVAEIKDDVLTSSAAKCIWLTVILQAKKDLKSNNHRLKREAGAFFFGKKTAFSDICNGVGIDPIYMREKVLVAEHKEYQAYLEIKKKCDGEILAIDAGKDTEKDTKKEEKRRRHRAPNKGVRAIDVVWSKLLPYIKRWHKKYSRWPFVSEVAPIAGKALISKLAKTGRIGYIGEIFYDSHGGVPRQIRPIE